MKINPIGRNHNLIKELFLLDPDVIYLNHGSFGACPRPVFEVYQKWQSKLEQQPVRFMGRELDAHLTEARHALGEYIHADPDEVVYVPNATQGVNIVARSLGDPSDDDSQGRFLQPGDEILTTDHEYGACDNTWEYVCRQVGSIYKHQSIPLPVSSQEEIVEQFWEGVTPKTRVIFLSHITSPTAMRMPVEVICKRARKAGILTVVDGAHAPGQIQIDMHAISADFYAGNCHKWMMSPKGAGFLFTRREAQHLIKPLVVSWGYGNKPQSTNMAGSNLPKQPTYINYLQWTGTRDPASYLSVPSAIRFMEEYHWDDIRQECNQLLTTAIHEICNLTGLQPVYPYGETFYRQMAIIPMQPNQDLNNLKNRLYDEYHIEVPLIQWKEKPFIRLSVQGYNTPEEIGVFIKALGHLLTALSDEHPKQHKHTSKELGSG